MKKLTALLLTLVMLISCIPVTALADDTVSLDTNSKLGAIGSDAPKKADNIMDRLLPSVTTTDTVTIDNENGVITVLTEDGIQLTATLPFGTVGLTQDLIQQLDLYQALYNDISGAAEYFIKKGMHLEILNYLTYTDSYVLITSDSIAALVGNASTLSDKDAQYILDYMSRNWYSGLTGEIKTINGMKYFVFDAMEGYNTMFYETFIGGKDITVQIEVDSSNTDAADDINAIINCLEFKLAE